MNNKLLYCAIGDEVELTSHSGVVYTGVIVRLTHRYGLINQGQDAQAPLLTIRLTSDPVYTKQFSLASDDKAGDLFHMDACYVTRVIQRAKTTYRGHVNVCRDMGFDHTVRKVRRNVLRGLPIHLASYCLSKVTDFPIDHSVDSERFIELFNKTGYGLIRTEDLQGWGTVFEVNEKRFSQWVRRNYSRIKVTVAQLRKQETDFHLRVEEDYWTDFEQDLIEDWFGRDNMEDTEEVFDY